MAQNEQYKIVVVIDGKDNASVTVDKLNKGLKELDSTQKQAGQSAGGLKGAYQGLANSLGVSTGALTGGLTLAAGAAYALTSEMYALGRENIAAETTFQQVSGGVDNANASLARMREMTGGVIDDLDLMRGANSLLVTGVAQTNEQAEELVNLGSRLGAVMGVDATESIQNLNSALLNNSFLRLDTLGISASRVRERVNELKEAGYDMSEAFSQAVIEIGTQTLQDLGNATDVGVTAVARLTTRWENFAATMSEQVAGGIEFVAEKFEDALTAGEQLVAIADVMLDGRRGNSPTARETEVSAISAAWEDAPANAEFLVSVTLENPEFANDVISGDVATQLLSGEVMTRDIELNYGLASGSLSSFAPLTGLDNSNLPGFGLLAGSLGTGILDEAADDVGVLSTRLELLEADFQNAETAVADYRFELERTAEAERELARTELIRANVSEAAGRTYSVITSELNELRGLYGDVLETMDTGNITTASGLTFFDPEQLALVQNQAEAVVAEYERLKVLAESSDYSLVTEEQVSQAQDIAESATEVATQAERNAKAWENASLAMLSGTSAMNGAQNEFNQMILAQIDDPVLRAQVESTLNLQSGAETENSRLLEYGAELSAAVGEEYGAAAGANAGTKFFEAYVEGVAAGLEGEALQDFIEGEVGFALGTSAEGGTSVGGQQITVQANDTLSGISAETGIPLEELIAANGGSTFITAGQVITVGDNKLIALDENTPIETVSGAAGNVLGRFGDSNIQAISADSAAPMMAAPTSDYTYFNPSTGTYESSNNPAAAPIAPETAEAIATVEDDMLSIDTSVQSVAATDLSVTFDPMLTDVDEAVLKIDEFSGKLQSIADMDLSIEMPISFVFDQTTAELLARNSQVVETIRLVLDQISVPHS